MGEIINLIRKNPLEKPRKEIKNEETNRRIERMAANLNIGELTEEIKEEGLTPEGLREEIRKGTQFGEIPVIPTNLADRADGIGRGKTWSDDDPEKPGFKG